MVLVPRPSDSFLNASNRGLPPGSPGPCTHPLEGRGGPSPPRRMPPAAPEEITRSWYSPYRLNTG